MALLRPTGIAGGRSSACEPMAREQASSPFGANCVAVVRSGIPGSKPAPAKAGVRGRLCLSQSNLRFDPAQIHGIKQDRPQKAACLV
jgi:hypothetical protein